MFFEDVSTEMSTSEEVYEPKIGLVERNFLEDLQKEQNLLNEEFPICNLLIDEAYDRIYSLGLVPGHDSYADVMKLKPMKLKQRVSVPVQEYPELNLTNKVLKLKGNLLKSLEGETQCQILIKGRNSMTDQIKEEELRLSKDPRYVHLKKELFLEVIAEATPIECYTRIAYALAEIRKYLLPETNDHNNEILPDAVNNSKEQIKIEQFEEPPLDIDLKESNLEAPTHLVAKTEAPECDNPLSISLADKLIKLLDETVLNPNFQYSENETNMVSNHIEVLSSFMVSKTSTKPVPSENASTTSLENNLINITPTTSSACSSTTVNKLSKKKSKNEKLGISAKRIVKRKKTKDSIKNKSIKIKMDKLKAIKKRNLENALEIKKNKYPGIFYMKDTETDKIVIRKISNKSSLSHCLKRSNTETSKPDQQDIDDDEYKPFTIEHLQQNPSELVFELTPREIIITLLESMKSYPVLWEFHNESYNEDYSKAIEYLCEIMNDKWLLNIEPLQMRRSITRILRFYRFLFPFDNIEKYTEYFEKCAIFLPSAVIEIPHARCSHCYRCFKRDKELKSHLLTQHDSLKWPYKCPHCRESFRTTDEYEFHKRLPHYLEAFNCPKCNKKFNDHKAYKRHAHYEKSEVPRTHVCEVCQKAFRAKRHLTTHKRYHEEKKYKCHLCPCTYYSCSNLTMHLKKHRKELNYICDVCGKAYVQLKNLQEHMDMHTGFKVTCNICNLKVRKYNLNRHLRTVHVPCEGTIESTFRARSFNYKRGQATRVFNPDNIKRKRRPADKPRQYECKVCNIHFDRLKVLKDHNKELHSDLVQKLPCKMCDSILSQIGNLKRHYRNKHKLPEYQIFAFVEKDMDINTVLAMTSDEAMLELTK